MIISWNWSLWPMLFDAPPQTKITAICAYYGYARQDRRVRSMRVPISARVVADMLVGAGISRVLTVDIHADQIQGFFSIPVDNVYSTPIFFRRY
jgi:ribose-phosphate pyrophosphokinase